MLDHVFTDAIGAMRDALESALLERQAFEERFQTDVLLGDVTFETSYGLPGEGVPPRIRSDIRLDWPTWSQTSYRSWYLDEEFTEPPRIEIGIGLRAQRLSASPDPAQIMAALPDASIDVGGSELFRSNPTVETLYTGDLQPDEHAIWVAYEGTYELDEAVLADGSELDTHFSAMGGWIAATLVRLGDVGLSHLPTLD